MLLKDFNITVHYYSRDTGPDEQTPMVNIIIRGKVVIKRDGKHYTVDCVKDYHEKVGFYAADMLQSYITYYLQEAMRIDEKWILMGELKDGVGRKILAEKPIEL